MLVGGAVVAAGILDDEGATAAYQPVPHSVSPNTSRSHTREPTRSADRVADDALPGQAPTEDDAAAPEPEQRPDPSPTKAQDDHTELPLPVPTPTVPSAGVTAPLSTSAPGVDLPSPRSPRDQATAGSPSATSAERTRPSDRTAPQTAIDSRPASHDDSRARFTFHASERSSFVCSLDGAGFQPCESGVTYDHLEPGWHDFAVRATDSAGNADTSPAGYRWHTSAVGWAADQAKDQAGDLLN